MPKNLTELHGRRAGITHDGSFLSPKGFVSGSNGKGIHLPSPLKSVVFDDFTGDTFDTNKWLSAEGTDSATSVAAILAGGIGGVLRLTSGNAGTGEAADAITCNGPLQWRAANGGLIIEARLKVNRITDALIFFGFTDVATGVEAPVTLATTTYTTNATDAVGFLFDTGGTTDAWSLVSVANDVDGAHEILSAEVPVADEYETLRVELNAVGDAKFFRNDVQIGALHSVAVTPGVALAPLVYWSNLSGVTSILMDVDYLHVASDRGIDGAAV